MKNSINKLFSKNKIKWISKSLQNNSCVINFIKCELSNTNNIKFIQYYQNQNEKTSGIIFG